MISSLYKSLSFTRTCEVYLLVYIVDTEEVESKNCTYKPHNIEMHIALDRIDA